MRKVTCAIPAERVKLAIDYDRNRPVTRGAILSNSTRFLCARSNDGTTFATRRSNAPSTFPVVGVDGADNYFGWKHNLMSLFSPQPRHS